MEVEDFIETISKKVMYSVGETITVIGLFITLVGLITMIYSYSPNEKQIQYDV